MAFKVMRARAWQRQDPGLGHFYRPLRLANGSYCRKKFEGPLLDHEDRPLALVFSMLPDASWSPPTRLVPQGAALSRGPSSQSGSTSSRARGPRTRCGPGAHLETQHLLDPSRRLPREETRRFSRPLFFPHFLLRGQKSSPNMCVEVVHVCSEELFCEGPPGVAQSCKGAHGCGIAQVFVPSFRIVCDSC